MGYQDYINQLDGKVRAKVQDIGTILFEKIKNFTVKKNHVAIDIGSHSVKCVEIFFDKAKDDSSVIKLLNASIVPLGPNQTQNMTIDVIKEALEKAGITTNFVNIAVGGENVVVRNIRIPRMSKEDLANAMKFEADKYIPFSAEEVFLDFHVVPDVVSDGRMHVLLAAAKKSLILKKINIIREAGYECGLVDIDSFAVINAFLTTRTKIDDAMPVALLDIGATCSKLNILLGKSPQFTRDLIIGGNDMTEAIADALDVSFDEAERLKEAVPEEKAGEIEEAITAVFEDLSDEIQRCFDYFENQSIHRVEKIFVTGGSSKSDLLTEYLRKVFKVDVVPWDPLDYIPIDESISSENLNDMRSLLAVAIGLGLRR